MALNTFLTLKYTIFQLPTFLIVFFLFNEENLLNFISTAAVAAASYIKCIAT